MDIFDLFIIFSEVLLLVVLYCGIMILIHELKKK